MCRRVALLDVAAREVGAGVLVLGAHRLAEPLDLLVDVEAEHFFLQLLVLGYLREAAVQAVVELVFDEGAEARPRAEPLELADGALHLRGLEEHGVVHADLAHVVSLDGKALDGALDALELRRVGLLAGVAVARALRLDEVAPGEDLRVRLAHGRQHGVDVALEHVVRRKEVDLVGVEGLAFAVEQKRDALQQDGRLSGACDAVDQQDRHVLVAHDGVLLALDRGGDGLELLGVVALERAQKQRVLDGHGGVEVHVELVADDVELAAQLQVDGALLSIDLVGGLAHLLVVVGLGHGAAPVDDERDRVLVGHAGGADVDVARGAARAHLQADLGEVGLHEQQDDAAELLDVEVVVLVVGVDDGVQGLDGRESLDGLVRAAEVQADLLGHVQKVLARAGVVALEVGRDVLAHLEELGVERREVLLLLVEDGICLLVVLV